MKRVNPHTNPSPREGVVNPPRSPFYKGGGPSLTTDFAGGFPPLQKEGQGGFTLLRPSLRGRGAITRLTFLVLLVTLSGCAAKTVNVYLEDKPTKLDQNFRQSVEQMVKIQRYDPDTYRGTKAGNHLEGWEAETVLDIYATPKK